MKKSIILIILLAGGLCSCEKEKETGEVFTRDAVITFRNQCGYFVHIYTGNMGHFHNMIYTPDNLPDAYKIKDLPVIVTYRHTKEKWICKNGELSNMINIIKIQKR